MNAKQTNLQAPDRVALTRLQASRLASLSGIAASELEGLSVAEISERFRWEIDPEWLLFRQICGQVVKADPVTGAQYPVPFATVYAQDMVCSLLGLFPVEVPWAWFFPYHCVTETVATTTTDACGNFCVWVPRFEIEWILRFRLERICYLQLLHKPTVGSVLEYLNGNATGPSTLKPGTALYDKAELALGSAMASRLASLGGSQALGSSTAGQQALLESPAFASAIAPPLPKHLRKQARHTSREEHALAVRSTLANQLGLEEEALGNLNLGRYFGPFLRCFDIVAPEWAPFVEVPDISFLVTQNVNGTGTETTIYSGGLFDIPWSTGNISSVTLLASPLAVSTINCNTPNVACGNTPSLEYAGLMPLVNPALPTPPYVDAAAGYATRPNQPHPLTTTSAGGLLSGPSVPPASAPYTDTLQLYGCNQVDGAVYYRLEFTYTAPGSTTPSALTPFTNITWPLYLEVGGVLQTMNPVSDANGWYPVIPAAEGWFPNSMVLQWDTTQFADGLYTVQLEAADGSKTLLATSEPVGFMVDNSVPLYTYTAVWSTSASLANAQPLPTDDCAVIDRGANPVDIYVQVSASVNANHLRSVQLTPGGCGGGPQLVSATSSAPQSTPLLTTQHWYEDEADNGFSTVAVYVIPASSAQGVYSFTLTADTRAFNPAGGDGGEAADWNYNPRYNYIQPSFSVAVVNEDPA